MNNLKELRKRDLDLQRRNVRSDLKEGTTKIWEQVEEEEEEE